MNISEAFQIFGSLQQDFSAEQHFLVSLHLVAFGNVSSACIAFCLSFSWRNEFIALVRSIIFSPNN